MGTSVCSHFFALIIIILLFLMFRLRYVDCVCRWNLRVGKFRGGGENADSGSGGAQEREGGEFPRGGDYSIALHLYCDVISINSASVRHEDDVGQGGEGEGAGM